MTLIEQIKADQIDARKTRDTVRASLLTTLLGELSTVAKNAGRELATDKEVVAMVKKFLKNIESIPESARTVVHDAETAILEHWLPKQLTKDELNKIKEELKPVNFGAWMKYLKETYEGQYDGKLASSVFGA